jgi:hypothetical protein
MIDDMFCYGCVSLKINKLNNNIYCQKSGINLSGTLERQDKCKKENQKQIENSLIDLIDKKD